MKKNLLVGLLMLLLCAFSWSTGIQDITAADADWKKGVTELVWFNGGTLSGDPAIAEGLLGWEKTTGIKVKVVEIPGEVYAEQLVRTLALKESTYDVVDASYMLPEWAKNGWILQMDDVISDSLKKQWDPAFLDYISWNGKMYAVPLQSGEFHRCQDRSSEGNRDGRTPGTMGRFSESGAKTNPGLERRR